MNNSDIRFSPVHRKFLSNIMLDSAARNLSLPMLAKKICVSRASVYSWIHERYVPTPENYNKLAVLFDWSLFKEVIS